MLTQEQLTQFEIAITQAIEKHLAKGGTLQTGAFGGLDDDRSRLCPISCLAIGHLHYNGFNGAVSEKMGFPFSDIDMWHFVHGFDLIRSSWLGPEEFETDLYKMGKKLREKYLPKT